MTTVTVELSHDLHVKVKKFADGAGVDLSELIERALIYALSSRYPDNTLPGAGGGQPGVDNELPRPPFDHEVDNELPEGEIPPEIDNSLPGYGGGRPDNTLPGGSGDTMPIGGAGKGRDANLDPNANPDLGRKSEAAKPKRQY